jgi:5'-nucleotidase
MAMLLPRFVRCSLLAFLAILAACRTAQGNGNGSATGGPKTSDQASGPIRLTIVGTNDVHGHVFPQTGKLRDGTPVEQGGVAIFAGYLQNIRADNPKGVILLDAGDLFQGTLVSNLTEGAVVVEAMNYLGYNAVAVGNHEFDYGPVGPVSVASRPDQDPFGALKARIAQAKFPFLAANIAEASSGARPAWLGNDGTALLDVKGLKIGVLGLITSHTPKIAVNVTTLRFGSLAPEADLAAKALRRAGADVVIGLVHAGGNCTRVNDPKDLSSCDRNDSELFEMLQELPPGTLDAVVAGHTHHSIGHFVNETPVIETWGMLGTFSIIELFVDPKKKTVLKDRTAIKPVIPICARYDATRQVCNPKSLLREGGPVEMVAATFLGKPIVPDPALSKLLEPAQARVVAEQNRKLGIKVPQALERKYEAESALGVLLADALREMEKADVSLLNPGGIRADIPAGELTYGDVYEVMPFENTIATVVVTGEELTRLLRAAYNGRQGVYAESGLQIALSRCPGPGRLKSVVLADGKPIMAEKKYRVAMPDFLARGGDGLDAAISSLKPNQIDLGMSRSLNFREAMVAHWERKRQDLVAPKLGRVKILDDAAACSAPGS